MKLFVAAALVGLVGTANAACPATTELPLAAATKLAFEGFIPSVTR